MTQTMTITRATFAQTAARAWEAEWFTNQADTSDGDAGVRVVTLRASHHEGVFTVTASIATAVEHKHFKVRRYRMFQDPMVRLTAQRARFSQKRLKEMFDGFYDHFDAEAFYAEHEVEH